MKTVQEVLEAFETAALKAGLARNTRKTYSFATGLLRNGVDVRVIQEQMGHTSLQTTEIYLHTAGLKTVASPLDTAASKIAQFLPKSA